MISQGQHFDSPFYCCYFDNNYLSFQIR
uniref:Photosystem I subunit XII n=1 Tax=Microbiota decussata TaxID=13614 RepID=A0A6J4AHE8_9CONI|nr:photosystem I subunit XII [Microbiota decussata]